MLNNDHLTHLADNAVRLFNDARFLSEAGRHASAFALTVLSLEEVGKLILDRWSISAEVKHTKGETAHRRKQRAALSLLVAKDMEHRFWLLAEGGKIDELSKDKAANDLMGGSAFQAHSATASGALEKAKHLAPYRDHWSEPTGLSAEHFAVDDVKAILSIMQAVLPAVAEHRLRLLGRTIYESDAEA